MSFFVEKWEKVKKVSREMKTFQPSTNLKEVNSNILNSIVPELGDFSHIPTMRTLIHSHKAFTV